VAQEALENAGFTASRLLEVSDSEAITTVVAAGLGVGIVSSAVVADQIALGRLSRLDIAGLAIRRSLTRLTLANRQPAPAAAAFNRILDQS